MAGRIPEKLIEYVQEMGLPVTLVDFYLRRFKTGAVLIDNIEGSYQAVVHLIQLGHQKIGFVGGDLQHPSIADRLEGFRKALNDHKLPMLDQFVVTRNKNTSIPAGYQAMDQILKLPEWPTAIFACNDAMAIGCIRRLKEAHIKIPDQIAIIGFDNIEADLEIEPHLSSMHVKKEELGAFAVRQMVRMLKNGEQVAEKILVPVDLVIRESTQNNLSDV